MKKSFLYVLILIVGSMSSFSRPMIVDNLSEIFDFTVVQNTNKMNIKFTVKQSTGSSYFTIEKSRDGKAFSKLIDIPASENSPLMTDYFETDYQPYRGVSYYRIKQTDFNGDVIYSQAVIAKYEQNNPDIDEEITASVKNNESKAILLLLRDMEGNDFVLKTTVEPVNNKIFARNAYPYLPEGRYLVVGSTNDKLIRRKIIVK